MNKRWAIKPHNQQIVDDLCRRHKLSPVVAQILASRDVTSAAQLDSFFDTRMSNLRLPEELPGVTEAVSVLLKAVQQEKRIVVYGDYDCDGMTATAILCQCLRQIGGNVGYFVPSRLEDGYGLNCDQIRKLKEAGTDLVVTVDCGVASFEEVELARQLGMEIVVTDHHLPGAKLPPANAIVHPGLPDSSYPFAGLCGAAVAFKLAWALCQGHAQATKLPPALREMLLKLWGLAAVGTIADVVPLVDENRILVMQGLKLLKTHAPIGFRALMRFAKLDPHKELAAEDVAFSLGPRLNAAGRLGQAQLGVELLLCDQEQRAEQLAEYLDNLNKSRDSLERAIMRDVKKQIENEFDPEQEPALVFADPSWHQGVLGIAAGRIAERYHRPTVVLRNDPLAGEEATGSARSVPGFNLHEALHACRQHLVSFGGHAAAAGLTIRHDQIAPFRESFCEYVSQTLTVTQRQPELAIDAEVALCQLNLEVVRGIEQLAPFGQGNPRPVLCVHNVQLNGEPKKMGSDGRHLSLQIRQADVGMRCVAFGQGEWAEQFRNDEAYDFAFKPVINEFRGYSSVELHLLDFRLTRHGAPVVSI